MQRAHVRGLVHMYALSEAQVSHRSCRKGMPVLWLAAGMTHVFAVEKEGTPSSWSNSWPQPLLQQSLLHGMLFAAVSTLAAALTKSQAEVARLTEWQDVVKRVADDRAAEAQQQLAAAQAAAAQQATAAAGEHQRSPECSSLVAHQRTASRCTQQVIDLLGHQLAASTFCP